MATKLAENTHIIVGMGATGLSCARFFQARKIPFVVMDTRQSPPNVAHWQSIFPDLHCLCGALDESVLLQAADIIVSPGVSIDEPVIRRAMAAGVRVRGDVDVFREVISKPIVAITGSNGKSTVTTLLGEMARAAGWQVEVAGNIGVPVLDVLDENGQENSGLDLYVLELSSFQLERLHELKAEAAVILNISADHMDRYSDLKSYCLAKQRIFSGVKKIVFNREDELTRPEDNSVGEVVSFGLDLADESQFGLVRREGNSYLAKGSVELLDVGQLRLCGSHNIANALAALALGECVGIPQRAMLSALKTFTGLTHRCQSLGSIHGIEYVNDSKGTNVGATVAAIEGLCVQSHRKVVLIAGGESKGADFSPLVESLGKHARAVVLLGKAAAEIAGLLNGKIKTLFADSMDAAVNTAVQLAQTGDYVLLSPACASFDMFSSYEERGRIFMDAVSRLREEDR